MYGTVIYTSSPNNLGSGYGNRVVIEFDYNGDLYWVALNHMHFDSIEVSIGQTVTPGTYLGKSGYTGYTDPYGYYGEHLHLDVYNNKQAAINGEYYGATDFTFYEDPNGSFRQEILTSQNTPNPSAPS